MIAEIRTVYVVSWLVVVLMAVVECLQPYEKYAEGSCLDIRWGVVGGLFNESVNEWAASLRYLPAASKYHYHRLASVIPSYSSLSEDEFQSQFCYTRESHLAREVGRSTIHGFGQVLRDFNVASGDVPVGNRYLANTPRSSDKNDTLRETISHSDGVSFAFLVGCWENSNERVWKVLSLRPELTPKARKEILAHAKGLLFNKANFMFLRYDTCALSNPLLSGDPLFTNHRFTVSTSNTLDKKDWEKYQVAKTKKVGRNRKKQAHLTTTTFKPVRKLEKPSFFTEHVSGLNHSKRWSKKGLRKEPVNDYQK